MPIITDRKAALAEVTRLENIKAAISERLRAERKAALARNDFASAKQITKERRKLGQAHLRLVHAKRSINAATDLGPALKNLNDLAKDADRAKQGLVGLSLALKAAAEIVRILSRLSGAFA